MLKELAQLGSINPHKLDLVRDGLEKAANTAPDDDRVLLGRANLATRTGRYEEAAGWLDRCRQRPDDPAVWRGRLELAMATDDADGTREALRRLPGHPSPPPRCSSCAPGSRPTPMTPIGKSRPCGGLWRDSPIICGPWNDSPSWCSCRGASRNPPSFARKAELDRAKAQYEILLFRPDASSLPAPIARFAEALGRRQEARILWALALGAIRVTARRPRPSQG